VRVIGQPEPASVRATRRARVLAAMSRARRARRTAAKAAELPPGVAALLIRARAEQRDAVRTALAADEIAVAQAIERLLSAVRDAPLRVRRQQH
jgi:hypothetical protein